MAIWADPTGKEQGKARVGTPIRNGHVYRLEPTSTIKCGSQHSQTQVYPAMCVYNQLLVCFLALEDISDQHRQEWSSNLTAACEESNARDTGESLELLPNLQGLQNGQIFPEMILLHGWGKRRSWY